MEERQRTFMRELRRAVAAQVDQANLTAEEFASRTSLAVAAARYVLEGRESWSLDTCFLVADALAVDIRPTVEQAA